jgi:hypothetical protein
MTGANPAEEAGTVNTEQWTVKRMQAASKRNGISKVEYFFPSIFEIEHSKSILVFRILQLRFMQFVESLLVRGERLLVSLCA